MNSLFRRKHAWHTGRKILVGAFWVVEVCFGAVQTDRRQQQSLSLGAVAGYLLLVTIPCVSAQKQSPEEFVWTVLWARCYANKWCGALETAFSLMAGCSPVQAGSSLKASRVLLLPVWAARPKSKNGGFGSIARPHCGHAWSLEQAQNHFPRGIRIWCDL